jgi:hypothetical protein
MQNNIENYLKVISRLFREKNGNVQNFLVDFASKHSLKYLVDDTGNVIIFKKTCETAPCVAIQTQADFVHLKSSKIGSLFAQNNVRLFKKGPFIQAKWSNFGATSMAGLAVMLSLLESDISMNVECVFTFGDAKTFDSKKFNFDAISARQMIFIDGFQDATMCSSSLASCNYEINFGDDRQFIFRAPELKTFKLSISGTTGGLVGYAKNAVSAIKLVLDLLSKIDDVRLNSIECGSQDANVPTHTECVFTTTKDEILLKKIVRHFLVSKKTLCPNLQIKCIRQLNSTLVLSKYKNLFGLLNDIEQGAIKGSEMTFQNIFEVSGENGKIKIFVESPSKDSLKKQTKFLDTLTEKYGFNGEITNEILPLSSAENSKLNVALKSSYVGITPLLEGTLQMPSVAGAFAENIKDLDCAILSVCAENVGTLDERLLFSSLKNLQLWLEKFFENQSQKL